MSSRELEAQKLQKEWSESPRWRGDKRGYSADYVIRLRDSIEGGHDRSLINISQPQRP